MGKTIKSLFLLLFNAVKNSFIRYICQGYSTMMFSNTQLQLRFFSGRE